MEVWKGLRGSGGFCGEKGCVVEGERRRSGRGRRKRRRRASNGPRATEESN